MPWRAGLLAALFLLLPLGCERGDPTASQAGRGLGLTTLDGQPIDPFVREAPARVFLFVRGDCPISNRYAPELRRLHERFAPLGVEFWLVYPDPEESVAAIREHLAAYAHPGTPLRDLDHDFVGRTGATVTPEAALFDAAGNLAYLGRIDDRFVAFGEMRARPTVHDLADALEAVLGGRSVPNARSRAIGCYIPALD